MKKLFSLLAVLFLFQHPGYSQKSDQARIDSLFTELTKAVKDTTKLNLFASILSTHIEYKPEEGLKYEKVALELAQKTNLKTGLAAIKDVLGRLNWRIGNFNDALKNHFEALEIYTQTGNKYSEGRVLVEIGQDYVDGANYPQAMAYLSNALKVSEDVRDTTTMSATYDVLAYLYDLQGNIAEAMKAQYAYLEINEEAGNKKVVAHAAAALALNFQALGNYEEALKYFKRGEQEAKQSGYKREEASIKSQIGDFYSSNGNFPEAIKYYSAAISLAEETKEVPLLADTHLGMGNLYQEQGNYTEALNNYLIAAVEYKSVADKQGLASLYSEIGITYTYLKKYRLAKKTFSNAMVLCKEVNSRILMRDYYRGIELLDSATGNWKSAYQHHKLYVALRDSVFDKEMVKKMMGSQIQYENGKKDGIAKAEQEKKDALANAEISRQKIIRNFSIIGVLGILFLGGYMFYNFRKRKKLEGLQALSHERLRISRELHDDIGSTLGSIAVYSDVAKNRSQKNENPVDVLSKIGIASRELIEKIGDIVWSLNPDNETFEQLQNRMEAFAAMILTSRNISFDFKTEGELKTVILTNEQRKNIFLIYKEALHNILKYADCKNVLIAISKSGNHLSLTIKDDGKGFDSLSFEEGRSGAYNGNGLKNMKARATEMNASITIASVKDEGTQVELKMNI